MLFDYTENAGFCGSNFFCNYVKIMLIETAWRIERQSLYLKCTDTLSNMGQNSYKGSPSKFDVLPYKLA